MKSPFGLLKLEKLMTFLEARNVNFAPFFEFNSTRHQILWGAAQIFGEKGFHQVTVQDILSSANISRRTFYQAFQNKEDVLASIFEIASEMIQEMLEQVVKKEETIQGKLEIGINSFLDFLVATGPLGNFLLSESMRPESPLCKQRVALYGEIVKFMDNTLYTAQQRHLDPMVYQILIFAIVGTALHLYQEKKMRPQDVQRAKLALIAIASRAAALPEESTPPLPTLE